MAHIVHCELLCHVCLYRDSQ